MASHRQGLHVFRSLWGCDSHLPFKALESIGERLSLLKVCVWLMCVAHVWGSCVVYVRVCACACVPLLLLLFSLSSSLPSRSTPLPTSSPTTSSPSSTPSLYSHYSLPSTEGVWVRRRRGVPRRPRWVHGGAARCRRRYVSPMPRVLARVFRFVFALPMLPCAGDAAGC